MSGVTITLPDWLPPWQANLPRDAAIDDDAAMALALEACRRNIAERSGGPFGAVVLDERSRELLAVGVNLVLPTHASVMHAEIVALTLAQQHCGSDYLGASGRSVTLYSTAEPCAMCMGAIPWSGINRLVCAARDADARACGFDEGDKPTEWASKLRRRGISVRCDFGRAEAIALLQRYRAEGGSLYGQHH